MDKWRSISRRWPLLMSGFLLLGVAAFSLLAHQRVEEASLLAARERLYNASSQIASILQTSLGQVEARVEGFASSDVIRAVVQSGYGFAGPVAAGLRDQIVANAQPDTYIEVLDAGGRVLLSTAPPSAPPLPFPEGGPITRGVTRIYPSGDDARYAVLAPLSVESADGAEESDGSRVLGWAVLRLSLMGAQNAVLFARMLGSDAQLLLTNQDGGIWSDFSEIVAGPVEFPGERGSELYYYDDSAGEAQVAVASAVPGTPWLVWVSLPAATVLAPAADFAGDALRIAIIVLVLGTAGVWLVSRRVTQPLVRLADAASGIAAGDLHRRVTVGARDEIGLLERSFNTMADRMEEAHHVLEERVVDRTAELRDANRALVEAQAGLVRQERLATLGQLASGVGHELRNPLGVMGNAVYYLEMILEEAPPRVTEYLGILKSQLGLSEKIVSDLLDSVRIRSPDRHPMILERIVDAQVDRVRGRPGVRIEKAFPEGLPRVFVDPVQVGQVVYNLLLNGAQAMAERGGTIRVRGGEEADGRVRLDVMDEGPGVPPEDVDKIFEPLYTTRARGMGLGLSVSRALAENNGGELRVSGSPPHGATFSLLLPTLPGDSNNAGRIPTEPHPA